MSRDNENPDNFSAYKPGELEDSLSPVQREQLRLLDEQGREACALEMTGIAETARDVLRQRHADHVNHMRRQGTPIDDIEPILEGPTVLVSVALQRTRLGGGKVVEKPAVRFAQTYQTPDGHVATHYDYVEMTEGKIVGSDEDPMPAYGFTSYEVEVAEGMLAKRQQDYQNGFFPHLNPDLASIFDPSTAMMKRPTEE